MYIMDEKYYRDNKINNDLAVPFLVEFEFENVAFEERKTPENPEKNLSEQRRNQHQAQPTYGVDARN